MQTVSTTSATSIKGIDKVIKPIKTDKLIAHIHLPGDKGVLAQEVKKNLEMQIGAALSWSSTVYLALRQMADQMSLKEGGQA